MYIKYCKSFLIYGRYKSEINHLQINANILECSIQTLFKTFTQKGLCEEQTSFTLSHLSHHSL